MGEATPSSRPARVRALALAAAVLVSGCSVEPGGFAGQEQPLAIPDAPEPTPGFGLLHDEGVTEAACDEATNPDNGCIHLGALVETSGRRGIGGRAALAGAEAFWEHVNQRGGVVATGEGGLAGRFDVEVTSHRLDPDVDVEGHLAALDELPQDVLALALSMGATSAQEVLHRYRRDDLVAVPLGGWSGWPFEPIIAQSGASHCIQAINAMDRAAQELEGDTSIGHVVVVHGPGRSGDDVVRGVEYWTEPDGYDQARVPFDRSHHAVTVAPGGDAVLAIERIERIRPDVVVVATGPRSLEEIAAALAESEWQGVLVGMPPVFDPSVLRDDTTADVLEHRYLHIDTVGSLTSPQPAYHEMRAALGLDADRELQPGAQDLPQDLAWVTGWVSQYPLHQALRESITAGDLTRAGVADVVGSLTVTYEGALPRTAYAAAPNDEIVRETFVYRPDRDAPMGLRQLDGAYVGDTAARRYLTRPCTAGPP